MQVLDERKARGIADTVGRDAQARLRQPRQAHPRAELLEKLSGAPADAPKTGYAAFAPPIVDRYLKEHLFCDIFERDLLTWQERELAAVAILTALGEGAPADAAVALRHLPAPGAHGRPAPPDDGNRTSRRGAGRGCKAMPARRMVSTARGGRRDFRPGRRNSWHSHEGGQLLLCTSGRGYYQETGKPIRLLLPGRCGEDSIIMWLPSRSGIPVQRLVLPLSEKQ